MKRFIALSIILLATKLVFAQISVNQASRTTTKTPDNLISEYANNNQIYLEGSFFIQSLNFETKIFNSKSNSFRLNGRLGLGYFRLELSGENYDTPGGMGGLACILGKKNHHFEATLGMFLGSDKDESGWWPIGLIGYRYQKPEGGFIFKADVGTLGISIGLGHAF